MVAFKDRHEIRFNSRNKNEFIDKDDFLVCKAKMLILEFFYSLNALILSNPIRIMKYNNIMYCIQKLKLKPIP